MQCPPSWQAARTPGYSRNRNNSGGLKQRNQFSFQVTKASSIIQHPTPFPQSNTTAGWTHLLTNYGGSLKESPRTKNANRFLIGCYCEQTPDQNIVIVIQHQQSSTPPLTTTKLKTTFLTCQIYKWRYRRLIHKEKSISDCDRMPNLKTLLRPV